MELYYDIFAFLKLQERQNAPEYVCLCLCVYESYIANVNYPIYLTFNFSWQDLIFSFLNACRHLFRSAQSCLSPSDSLCYHFKSCLLRYQNKSVTDTTFCHFQSLNLNVIKVLPQLISGTVKPWIFPIPFQRAVA